MARALIIIDALEADENRLNILESVRLRRCLRDQAKPLNLSESLFRKHYRISKHLFLQLCSELKPLLPRSHRRTRVTVECKVLTALSFFATGSYQKPVGMNFLHTLSQASVSKAIREVTMALNNLQILKKHLKFPQTQQERSQVINGFYNKFGFPVVLGCIDGTHVALVRPAEHEERFFNRKHYHSRNVQIICDSDLNILNVDATFGGATHDAFVWRNSELNMHIQDLHHNGENVWFLGDSGYPLRSWLLTPIVNALPRSMEEYYTNLHCRTRNTVERCIGVLKARWRCLLAHRVLHYDHHMVAKIINACCVLHNMANRYGLPAPQLPDEDVVRDVSRQMDNNVFFGGEEETQHLASGRRQRSMVVQRLWRNRR
ncbi:putative nuclease HARBI1 [Bombyx mandarina]|uniref:Nuclease HARBI1 n=1 Tax=Bombyx mandarina TaxID=7092 RepID=A0A6J2JWT2_BOMMA|nr:putative nuclease HARBI1 [Bombyx mandarina]XP_028034311.1 putative nuclease HARBI1 [Bombyx mandarina]